MSFDLKHLPHTFADLVIANPLNAAVIKSYCDQPPAKPLLLAGPPGAGKTEAARVIAQNHFLRAQGHCMRWEYNAASLGKTLKIRLWPKCTIKCLATQTKR